MTYPGRGKVKEEAPRARGGVSRCHCLDHKMGRRPSVFRKKPRTRTPIRSLLPILNLKKGKRRRKNSVISGHLPAKYSSSPFLYIPPDSTVVPIFFSLLFGLYMELMVMSAGGGGAEENSGCSTPERWECKIPQRSVPPPPPRKKPFSVGRERAPPKNGYFEPPDLEKFFFARRQACV